jgi:hypothetical protein
MAASAVPEPRSAVMILVDVSWHDHDGTLHTTRACMENRSIGGVCIRCRTAIDTGVKLSIQGRWEHFSGVSKYCRTIGKEFLVGIQRDRVNTEALPPDSSANTEPHYSNPPPPVLPASPPPSPAPNQSSTLTTPAPAPHQPDPAVTYETLPGPEAIATAMEMLRVAPRSEPHAKAHDSNRAAAHHRETGNFEKQNAHTAATSQESQKEKKSMTRKWLEVGQWGKKDDAAGQDFPAGAVNGHVNGKSAAHPAASVRESDHHSEQHGHPATHAPIGDSAHGFVIELSSMEDIYRAAGIVTPRRGYSITKIAEMLRSEHIRGLSKEMRRAAVLMALDAAEVSADEVFRDAKTRQQAIDNYEAEQRRQIEAEWARKSEENAQIQAELERVKSHYMDRIKRNMEGMAREKAAFGSWLTVKQQESQSISEAVDLCLKPGPESEPAASLSEIALPEAVAKPV